jgi:hypothetical protein
VTTNPTLKPPRALLSSFPAQYSLPAKPTRASPHALDAHRQTTFLLTEDLALFERAMNLQLTILAANSKVRGPQAAALFSLWSRAFTHLADACTLISQGSYASCPALLRVALDSIAVQRSLIANDFADYEDWYPGAITQDRDHAALGIDTGHYKAASVLISDPRLGDLYRLLMDLSLPHFGTALFLAAPEASLQKIPLAFADSSFHLGLAQLTAGWLLLLAAEQLTTAASSGLLTVDAEIQPQMETVLRDTASQLDDNKRCYVERIDHRCLIHNFRRGPAGQPRRILLAS